MTRSTVLFAGGAGCAGRRAVGWFRSRHPHLHVIVGGRTLTASDGAALIRDHRLGRSSADIAAVVTFTPDDALQGAALAHACGVPYITTGNGSTELDPEVAWFAHHSRTAVVVLASQWLGGAAVALALRAVDGFDTVDSITIGALVDDHDVAGPLGAMHLHRPRRVVPAARVIEGGDRRLTSANESAGHVIAIDGRRLVAEPQAPSDIVCLSVATGASRVRFDLAAGTSSSRRRGGAAAAEITVEITGRVDAAEGSRAASRRSTVEFAAGRASLTGLCVVLSLEAALGLADRPAAQPGLYFPELLSPPDRILGELDRAGADIAHGELAVER